MPKKKDKKDKKASDAYGAAGAISGDVHAVIVVDESGSMSGLEESVTTGINRLVAEFRKGKGRARVSLLFFDAHPSFPRVRVMWDSMRASDVPELRVPDYTPRGMTPLYDAICDGAALLGVNRRKDEVGFLTIITDGAENSSETKVEAVRKMLADLEARGDSVLFMGANIDAAAAATDIGLSKRGSAFSFTASRAGTQSAFVAASTMNTSRRYSGSGVQGQTVYDKLAEEEHARTGGVIAEEEEDDA